ncbi:LLM class flavin-dependent oxidoreductase [Phytohabitans sp. ZYX-F-186]|uniref:LLM class flavin-dependent oxidoreductase n=1 Tax=Phytohabitans maris TaxID=3071409 RepID=A0ABU0ZW59_9ACTN|nr:LLM class flavin-dependent oxidoreductase [Phytohabitans sp. ZYX-F-186]MDQ7911266.1 LLM class flavin-dependent oxidoreductase [Phytohabitans sp. ZYX-F-186]
MSVTFGFGMISAQRDPRDPRTDADLYAALLDLCADAERLGYDAVWVTEHHFVDDGYMPSLLPVCAAIAARTSRIRIGTGVVLAPLYHPLRLAEDAATVDLISRGRLVLGLGAGYREEEFAGLGVPRKGSTAALEATITALRRAWSGEPVTAGEGDPVRVTPRPYPPDGPPIWLGARKRPGIRRAARMAQGLLAARVTPDEFAAQVRVLREEMASQGRDPSGMSVAVHCPVFAWPGPGAWDRIAPHLHYLEWKYADMVSVPYGQRTGTGAPPPLTPRVEATLRAGALVGTPAAVAAAVAAYARAAGDLPFHFVARLYWPGLDPVVQREAMAVFASEVIPALAGGA